MLKLEPKKDCWQKEAKHTISNMFRVAELTGAKNESLEVKKYLMEYIEHCLAEFEKEKTRMRKLNNLKDDKTNTR